jgi:hypothetical protein
MISSQGRFILREDYPFAGKWRTPMPPPLRTFKGTSKNGNVQKALDAAIQAALQSAQGADRMVQWTLKVISGRRGGIAGFNEVTVAIRARVS